MNKLAIVVPYKFTASKNILDNLKEIGIPPNVEVVKVEKESVYNENLDKEIKADYFIFATRHQSTSGTPSLCVHPIGNFNSNDIGGKVRELGVSMPGFMKVGLKFLEEKKLEGYEIEMEATHHGPYLQKPTMFIEIGSGEKEWGDDKAGKVIAEAILEVIRSKKKFKKCIVLGGGHYNRVAKKLMLQSEYAVGHICPKHNLEFLDEKMLEQMLKRNGEVVDLVVLDWKGLGKEKERIIKLLEDKGVKYEKYKDLKE
jgi:D-aminoacyl-tRNA deacylase